jgi:hypothetical protein
MLSTLEILFMTEADPTPFDHIVFTEFDDAEGILVDLNTKKYYQLNETAMVIWKGLEKGLTSHEIANELVTSYEISREDALLNVENTLINLKAHNLIGAK